MQTKELKKSYEQIYSDSGIADVIGFYRWINRLIDPQPNQRLLDVACGEGLLIREAGQRGAAAYGLDIAQAAIQRARRRYPEGNFLVGDGEHLPFPENSFDWVSCLGSLENMLHSHTALREMIRVTKPGGRLCLMMPNAFWLGDILGNLFQGSETPPFQMVEKQATRREWRTFLQSEGLDIEKEARFNRPAILFKNGKLRSLRKFVVRSVMNLLTPFNLSWSFVYLCRKNGRPADPNAEYWIWEAQQSPALQRKDRIS